MKVAVLAFIATVSATSAFADYTHGWVYKNQWQNSYTGVEIRNTGSRKISCNVTVRLQQCFGWNCNTVTRGGPLGIIYPGRSRVSGYFKGGPVSYNTSCNYVN